MRSLCNHNCFTICEKEQPLEQCFTKVTAADPNMNHPEQFFDDMGKPEVIERLKCYGVQMIEGIEALTESKQIIKRKAGPIVNPRRAQHCKHVENVEPKTTDMSTARPNDNAHFGDANEHS